MLDGGPNEGNHKQDGFLTPSCYDFGECDTASVHLHVQSKIPDQYILYSIPNLGGGGGPRPDTDKQKFRGPDLKVPGIPLLKILPDPPPSPLPLPHPSSCSKEYRRAIQDMSSVYEVIDRSEMSLTSKVADCGMVTYLCTC